VRWISIAGLIVALGIASIFAHTSAPVAAQDGTPVPGTLEIAPGVVAEEVLIPAGEPAIFRFHIDPGASVSFPDTDPSLSLVVVEAGTLTASFDGPIGITRAGAADAPAEAVAAGTEFTASIGDYFVAPASTALELGNDGTETVTLLVATLFPPVSGATGTPEARITGRG